MGRLANIPEKTLFKFRAGANYIKLRRDSDLIIITEEEQNGWTWCGVTALTAAAPVAPFKVNWIALLCVMDRHYRQPSELVLCSASRGWWRLNGDCLVVTMTAERMVVSSTRL